MADLIELLTDYPSVVALSRSRTPEAVADLLLATCRTLVSHAEGL